MRNLKALEAYLVVATLGSVTAAARHLNTSQPSVSRMIQDLERELDQPLFERVGQRLVLTRVGMLLRDDVERALSSVADVMVRARSLGESPQKPLRVAAVSSLAFGLLPHACQRLDPETRGEMVIETTSPERVRSEVCEGNADIGASSLPLEHRDLTIRWMGAAPCVLAVREDDPLAQQTGPVALAALRHRTMVGLGNPRGLPSRIRRALAQAGVARASIQTNSTMNVLAFVLAGCGISVIEPLSSAGTPVPDVRLLPLETSIPYHVGVVTPNPGQPCDRSAALIAALQAEAEARVPGFVTSPPEAHHEIVARMALLEETP